jgi:hypothetical protein
LGEHGLIGISSYPARFQFIVASLDQGCSYAKN